MYSAPTPINHQYNLISCVPISSVPHCFTKKGEKFSLAVTKKKRSVLKPIFISPFFIVFIRGVHLKSFAETSETPCVCVCVCVCVCAVSYTHLDVYKRQYL